MTGAGRSRIYCLLILAFASFCGGYRFPRIFKPKFKVSQVVPVESDREERTQSDGDPRGVRSSYGDELYPETQAELETFLVDPERERVDQFGEQRQSIDADLYSTQSERVPSDLRLGADIIQVDPKPLGKSTNSVVKVILPSKKWVIKYSVYCRSEHEVLDAVDPVLVEAWFLERLMKLEPGLAPKVLYYSAGSYDRSMLGQFLIPTDDVCYTRDPSAPLEPPTVRYIISERFGLSGWKYWKTYNSGELDFFEAIRIGGQMIKSIERLHEHDFIHGDIHLGNIAIKDGEFRLIDFGRAKIINTEEIESLPEYLQEEGVIWFHEYLSKWEVNWKRPSFRDDVFRAMQMMGFLIHGDKYINCLGWMADVDNRDHTILDDFVHFKEYGNLFVPELVCPVEDSDNVLEDFILSPARSLTFDHSLSRVSVEVILESLNNINTIIRDPELTISSKPDYAAIHRELEIIILFDPNRDELVDMYHIPELGYF